MDERDGIDEEVLHREHLEESVEERDDEREETWETVLREEERVGEEEKMRRGEEGKEQ